MKTEIAFIALLIIGLAAYRAFQPPVAQLPSLGTIKTLGCETWWDKNKTIPATEIQWGTLWPGENKTVTLYCENNGTTAGYFNTTIHNWNPTHTPDHITVDHNMTGIFWTGNHPHHITIIISPDISNVTAFTYDTTIINNKP